MRITLLFLFALCVMVISCDHDDDTIKSSTEIEKTNEFVYEAMKYFYLWNDKIPNKDISAYTDPKKLFDDILYKRIDRWSIITDDFPGLIKRFEGINKSFGSVIFAWNPLGKQNVFGVVMYVYKDSPAYNAGLKRGDIIIKVDGQTPTTENYQYMFSKESYTVTLGLLTDKEIVDSGKSLSMAREVINEYPILHNEVMDYNGTKIGYLVYDSFIHRFDEDLKTVFADFQENNVTELIIDLRYNSGGDDVSAQLLANLIAPKSAVGKYFFKSVYNDKLTEYYAQNKKVAEERHADGLKFEDVSEGLALNRVFILTSDMSASASELVINGLEPVMNVYTIGDTTHGKCTGMTGIPDDEDNPKWGIFPVIVKASNSEGVTDYYDGLIPDKQEEEKLPLFLFGDKKDPFIAAALSQISGIPSTAPTLKTGGFKFGKLSIIGGKPDICKNILMH